MDDLISKILRRGGLAVFLLGMAAGLALVCIVLAVLLWVGALPR